MNRKLTLRILDMTFIKHSLLLYILKFESKPWIKIGVSKNLGVRIKHFRKIYRDRFDLVESFVITGRTQTIKILESQLLDDSYEYVPDVIGETRNLEGHKEIRHSDILELIIPQFEQKAKLNTDLQLYSGIDLSGLKSDIIPRELFPHDTETYPVLKIISETIERTHDKKEYCYLLTLNEMLYQYLVSQGLFDKYPNDKKLKSGYFLVRNDIF